MAILDQFNFLDGRLVSAFIAACDVLKPSYLNPVVTNACGQGLSPKLLKMSNQLVTVEGRGGAVFLFCPTLGLFGKTENI